MPDGTGEVNEAGIDFYSDLVDALLAHGRAVQTIRAVAKQPPKIGIAPIGVASIPATEQQVDIDAARQGA